MCCLFSLNSKCVYVWNVTAALCRWGPEMSIDGQMAADETCVPYSNCLDSDHCESDHCESDHPRVNTVRVTTQE